GRHALHGQNAAPGQRRAPRLGRHTPSPPARRCGDAAAGARPAGGGGRARRDPGYGRTYSTRSRPHHPGTAPPAAPDTATAAAQPAPVAPPPPSRRIRGRRARAARALLPPSAPLSLFMGPSTAPGPDKPTPPPPKPVTPKPVPEPIRDPKAVKAIAPPKADKD